MGLMLSGREWQDMWGVVMLMPLFLEICANGGTPYKGALHEDSPRGPLHDYKDYQQLEDDVIAWFALFAERYVKENERRGMARLPDRRNPFVSALLHDCLERGRDVQDGGVRFRIMVFEPFGLADLANGLYAIREMVFKRKRFTLDELNGIVRDNFAGHEDVRLELARLPKYGQNDSEMDCLMAHISECVADIIIGLSPKNIICAPSFHTLAANVSKGCKAMAGFDGRLAGTPLSKNAGTRPDITKEPTSMLLSAAAVDQRKFFGGQPVDLWLNGEHWFTPEGRHRFRSMLETYFARGGLQVQVNGVSRGELEEAMAHPEEHRDLIVRIGGFSRHFVDLSAEVQREFIARCES